MSAKIPYTFGIELEFVFAVNIHSIAQDPTHFLNQASGGPQADSETRQASEIFLQDARSVPGTSEAKFKGAEYVARILRYRGETVRIQKEPHHDPNFRTWQITYDKSVKVKKAEQLIDLFRNGSYREISRSGNTMAWSSYRASLRYPRMSEAVCTLTPYRKSPDIFQHWPPDLKTRGDRPGVGYSRDSSPSAPALRVLQRFAYILARYEEIISSFHSDQRRGFNNTHSLVFGTSNLMVLQGHGHCCGQYSFPELTIIQDKIFAEDMTVHELARLMGLEASGSVPNRFKFVNWQNLGPLRASASQPRTVEFRQHEGTLNIEEIGQWVCFITALMRTAERRAAEATPPNSPTKPPIPRNQLTFPMREGSKYKFLCTNHRDKTEDFFDLLQLPRQAKEYWMARYVRFAPSVFTEMPHSARCLPCELDLQLAEVQQSIRDAAVDKTAGENDDWREPYGDDDDCGEDQQFEDNDDKEGNANDMK